jgi:hypothetical protein
LNLYLKNDNRNRYTWERLNKIKGDKKKYYITLHILEKKATSILCEKQVKIKRYLITLFLRTNILFNNMIIIKNTQKKLLKKIKEKKFK